MQQQGGFNQGLGVGAGVQQGGIIQGGGVQQGGVGLNQGFGAGTGVQQGGFVQGGGVQQGGVGLNQGFGVGTGVQQGGIIQGGGIQQGGHFHQEGLVNQGGYLGGSLGGAGIGTTVLESGVPTTVYHKVTTVTQPQEVHVLHSAPIQQQQQVVQQVSSSEQYAQEALLRGVAPAGINDHAGGLGSHYGGGAQATGVNLTQTPYFSGTQPLVYQGNVPQVSSHGAHHAGGLITGQDPNLASHQHGGLPVQGVPIGTAGVLNQQSLGANAHLGGTGGVYNPQN